MRPAINPATTMAAAVHSRARLTGWLALGALACTSGPPSVDGFDNPVEVAPLMEVFEVVVTPPAAAPPSRGADAAGLVVALVELGLADLPGVRPRVQGSPESPALTTSLGPTSQWTLELAVTVDPVDPGVSVEATLCQDGACTPVAASAPKTEDPTPAVASVLSEVARVLDRMPPKPVVASWTRRGTDDDYAARMAGRSAALFYGLGESTGVPGDRRSDPVARAFYLDPGMPVAGWMVARSEGRGEPQVALRRASAARPESLLLQAELSAAIPHPRLARPVVDDLYRRAPTDPRFVVLIATNRLAVGEVLEASRLLDQLGDGASEQPAVARLRVAIADATGEGDEEELLQRWRSADRLDPEPVRRLIRRRVDEQRYADAQGLLPDLLERGVRDEFDALDLALRFAVGDTAGAAQVAERAGLPEVARAVLEPASAPTVRARKLPRVR